MKRITLLSSALIVPALILGVLLVALNSDSSFALTIQQGVRAAQGTDVPTQLIGDGGVFTVIVNILLFIIGVLSVIMLIIGGLRYVVSGGNATAVTGAKNTILYAIVGLVIAFLAYAAINWILTTLTGGTTGGGTNV